MLANSDPGYWDLMMCLPTGADRVAVLTSSGTPYHPPGSVVPGDTDRFDAAVMPAPPTGPAALLAARNRLVSGGSLLLLAPNDLPWSRLARRWFSGGQLPPPQSLGLVRSLVVLLTAGFKLGRLLSVFPLERGPAYLPIGDRRMRRLLFGHVFAAGGSRRKLVRDLAAWLPEWLIAPWFVLVAKR